MSNKRVKNGQPVSMVEFKGAGGFGFIERLPHAGHGMSRGEHVSRGVVKGREMLDRGIVISKNALRKVGVNSLIVSDVYDTLVSETEN
jgi:hypothetical protein